MEPHLLLIVTLLLPLVGAGWICVIGRFGKQPVRQSALITSLLTLASASLLVRGYSPTEVNYAATSVSWLHGAGFDATLSLGLDGLSLWLFGLSALLVVTSVLVSWEAISERPAAFYALLLLLETGMLGVFAARDLILFYVFFEFTLLPLFFLIGIWGSEQRRYAAVKFFLFTFAGSLLTFLGLIAIVLWNASHLEGGTLAFSFAAISKGIAAHPLPFSFQLWIFLALFAGFAVKVPLFPFHTWLPLAHVQAPTAGSVILAGVLLKIGTYGFLRFNLPLLPDATAALAPLILWLSAIGIIYGALVALAQSDIKRLIAYSSVSHLGYCMLGLFALTPAAVEGGVLQMINHGLSTGGLFAIVGMIYERYHTREIRAFGGLARRTPLLAVFLIIFTFSSIGLPGLNGFAGEFLILLGTFQRAWSGVSVAWRTQYVAIASLAVFGVVLGAWYMLWLVQRTFFGPLKEPHSDESHSAHRSHGGGAGHEAVADMSLREVLALAPLVVFVFWIGLCPRCFLEPMSPTVDAMASTAAAALDQRLASSSTPRWGEPLSTDDPRPSRAEAALIQGSIESGLRAAKEISERQG